MEDAVRETEVRPIVLLSRICRRFQWPSSLSSQSKDVAWSPRLVSKSPQLQGLRPDIGK